MLTLAEIKRRCVVGAQLELVWHPHLPAEQLPMPRTVTIVQTNAIAMTGWPGRQGNSWLYWPAASEVRIDGPDAFTILENGVPELTYRFV